MEVRTEDKAQHRLFDWEPDSNTIIIIRKNKRYKVKLVRGIQRYKIVEVSNIMQ